MSRAGQADAVGGAFRVTTATFLAIHGLRGQPVAALELPGDVHTVQLDFETDDPTDDIVATMSDGRRCYISAKRSVGNDRHLASTVDGWHRQMDDVRDGDLLVLAVEHLKGVVVDLAEALRRRRDGRDPFGKQRSALAAVTQHVPSGDADALLDRVRVLHIPSATNSAGLTRALLESLASYLVADGDGAALVSVLSDSFLTQSGAASSSNAQDWVLELRRASRPVIEDAAGPVGMRLAAGLAAVEAYRAALTADRGRVDLTLLADDLPPVAADGLLDGLRVRVNGEDRAGDQPLTRVVRRWRRLLLVGQPGAGKSVALRELAADCAATPHAPTPLHVHLAEVARAHPLGFSADDLVTAAARRLAAPGLREPLMLRLREELRGGTAVLLCDGLDECGPRAAWAAQQLADAVEKLHPDTGVVVATRHSAAAAAERLALPRADLLAPLDLDDTVRDVLRACARARLSEASRPEWLAVRDRWMTGAKAQHPELFNVPLLAVLLALICAGTDEADLPMGRALVLHTAVEQSVDRWESQRAGAAARPWARDLTRGMLLDGYVALGRRLDAGASPTRTEALDTLSAVLRNPDRWGLAPAAAAEVAADILRFWDEHVAVFVIGASDRLSSRSKVFSEIATAMWTRDVIDRDIAGWLAQALPHTDSDGAIALAAGLNGKVVEQMLDLAAGPIDQAAVLLGEFERRGLVELGQDQIGRLLRRLEDVARRADSGQAPAERGPRHPGRLGARLRRHGDRSQPGWTAVELACSLPLSPGLRAARSRVIGATALTPENAGTARALCALADAVLEERALDEKGLAAVRAVVQRPLPPSAKLVKESRRRSTFLGGADLGPGVGRVALLAVPHLAQLPDSAARWAFDVSMQATHGLGEEIRAALSAADVDTRDWWAAVSPFRHFMTWLDEHGDYESALLEDVASLAQGRCAPERTPPRDEMWSLADAADLLAATGYDRVSVPDFAVAFRHDPAATRRGWLDALADAHRIDKDGAARQAAWMLRQRAEKLARQDKGLDLNWYVATMPPAVEYALRADVGPLDAGQQSALVAALTAASGWLAWSAAAVLVETGAPAWDTEGLFNRDLSGLPVDRAALAYAVAIQASGGSRERLLDRAAASSRVDYRAGARLAVTLDPALDFEGVVLQKLRSDPDLTVRDRDDRKHQPAATRWTCPLCRATNEMQVEDCPGCDRGSRPD